MNAQIDAQSRDDGEIKLFVPEEEFTELAIPEPENVPFHTMESVILGVNDEALRQTVLTNVKMEAGDFKKAPKKLPRLIFLRKDDSGAALKGALNLFPAFFLLERQWWWGTFMTGLESAAEQKLATLLRANYLLLPARWSFRDQLRFQGVEIARRSHRGGSGSLHAPSFTCVGVFLFGEDKSRERPFSYATDSDFAWVLRNWQYCARTAEAISDGLREFDLAKLEKEGK